MSEYEKSTDISVSSNCIYWSKVSAQVKIEPSLGFILENKIARYVFEPVGMGLSAMVDLKTGQNHLAPVEGKHLLWEVVFGKGIMRPAIDNNYKPCSYGEPG